MDPYLKVTGRLPAKAEMDLAEALQEWPVLGCQVEDIGAEVFITVFMDVEHAMSLQVVVDGLAALGATNLTSDQFAQQDWLEEYRRLAVAMPIGERLWIDPHPQTPTPPLGRRVHLIIEPRQAFGTGSHESTKLVLLEIEKLDVNGMRVLDVGAGSGILALAVRAFGAAEVIGFDIDLDAVFIARQTVNAQLHPLLVSLYAGSTGALRQAARFDLILANLIPSESMPLLVDLRGVIQKNGLLLLSGVMADQMQAVEADLADCSFAPVSVSQLDEWVVMTCKPI